jgi:formylglycine-generating enzyme required for sulfatase activity
MDKYLITAGRVRAFITDVGPDVRTWAENHPPRPDWNATWGKSVPANATDVAMQLGPGQNGATSYVGTGLGPGCYVKGLGAPAYWFPDDVQTTTNGDIARAFTQDELDTKVMNCATRALFTAFCAWDGGRLPNYDEWQYAVRGGDSTHTYPWGTDANIGDYASYNFNYSWPRPLADGDVDRGAILPAPGRFPQGKGPFGHMDLAGAVENFSADTGGWMQYSFQEAGKEQYGIVYGTKRTNWTSPATRHWAVGARCVRSM